MEGIPAYYLIKDLNMVGKMEDFIPYLYDKDKGWVVDKGFILMDRLIGYDEYEEEGSPYKIGNTYMLDKVEEITEEEAKALIENQYK